MTITSIYHFIIKHEMQVNNLFLVTGLNIVEKSLKPLQGKILYYLWVGLCLACAWLNYIIYCFCLLHLIWAKV